MAADRADNLKLEGIEPKIIEIIVVCFVSIGWGNRNSQEIIPWNKIG